MIPEMQRIAIAEACGWKCKDEETGWYWLEIKGQETLTAHVLKLPNYLSDLNAMHEAEKMMTDEQMQQATFRLWEIVLTEDGDVSAEFTPGAWITVDLAAKVQRATAAQRAEAFLRTLNLWED